MSAFSRTTARNGAVRGWDAMAIWRRVEGSCNRKVALSMIPVYALTCAILAPARDELRIRCPRPRRAARDMDFHKEGSDADSGDGWNRLHRHGPGAAAVRGGHQVVALDYKEGLACDALAGHGGRGRDRVRDRPAAVERSMRGVEFVFHLAAAFRELNVPNAFYDEVNVRGTQMCLEAALAGGVWKFVYCSTCGVHGNVDHPPANEDAPSSRPTTTSGPSTRPSRWCKELAPGRWRWCRASGRDLRPRRPRALLHDLQAGGQGHLSHVRQREDALSPALRRQPGRRLLLCMPRARGTAANTSSPTTLLSDPGDRRGGSSGARRRRSAFRTTRSAGGGGRHVVEKLCKPFGIAPPIFPRRVDWYRQNRAFDIARAKRELGYAPAIMLPEGFRRTGEWYRRMGYPRLSA